ncbi:MAG: hypothetical protein VKO00_09265 [Cyanobacteriota bacterium]|nr:hypothetical protein [Cyanobacteriota bacterium]
MADGPTPVAQLSQIPPSHGQQLHSLSHPSRRVRDPNPVWSPRYCDTQPLPGGEG